ncbi:MAG: Agmatine deiminase [Myxococcaceae bacterium]|nr:Agmatine deiminase [Myxococcaceae bacterium]
MQTSPRSEGYRQPAEWAPHLACWVAFPSDAELWPQLAEVQSSFAAMCRAIASPHGARDGERLEILVRDEAARAQIAGLLVGVDARFHLAAFGDIWMRDIAPVFLTNEAGAVGSVRFVFNGWGGKYVYAGDELISARVQELVQLPAFASELVCEGGALESDGAGLCMTTREVALNPNRNPGRSERDVERALIEALGAERVVWVDRGLLNDHTDGHIDNTARFIGAGRVLCMHPSDASDPNSAVLGEIERALAATGLEVATITSPGLVTGRDGRPLPASYLNFYIANASVVVPTFGSRHDDAALAAFETLFPGRAVRGVPAKVLLEEGGTVHCITQQQPAAKEIR